VRAVPERLKNVTVRSAVKAETVEGGAYLYPHDFEGHIVRQAYMPGAGRYYTPTDQGYESTIGKRLARWEAALAGRSDAEQGGTAS